MNINLHLQRGEYSIMENRNETYNITSVLVYLIGTDEKNLLFYKEKKPLLFEKLYKHKGCDSNQTAEHNQKQFNAVLQRNRRTTDLPNDSAI